MPESPPTNPFVFNRPVGGPGTAYIRDTKTLDTIVNGLLLGRYYTILGPRVSGATSLIRDLLLTASEREEHCQCLYINLQTLPSPAVDEASLVHSIVQGLRGQDNAPLLDWQRVTSCASLREALLREVQGKPARLILAFDGLESELLSPDMTKLLVRCARVLYNQRLNNTEFQKISILISGSQSPYELSTGTGSPFNIAEKHWLRDLSQQETQTLVQLGAEQSGISFDPEAVIRIWEAASGDKYSTQRLCHYCVEEARRAGSQSVTAAMASRGIDWLVNVVYRSDIRYNLLIKSLKHDPDLVEIVKDLIEGEKAITAHYSADVSKMQLTGILKIDQGQYHFRNEIFRQLLERGREMILTGSQLHGQTKKLTSLHDVTLDIASTLDPEDASNRVIWKVLKASEAEAAAIYLYDRTTDQFHLEAHASTYSVPAAQGILGSEAIAREVISSQSALVPEEGVACASCAFAQEACSCIWLPLIAEGDALGVAVIVHQSPHDHSQDSLVNETLASNLAISILRTKLLRALQLVGSIPITDSSAEGALDKIATNACRLLNVPVSLIWGFRDCDTELQVLACAGDVIESHVRGFRLDIHREPTAKFLARQEPLYLPSIENARHYLYADRVREMGWTSALTMPLRARNRPIGIIEVYTHERWRVTAAQRALLKVLASQASATIDNTQLHLKALENAATLASLYEISAKLRTSLEPDDVLDSITSSLQNLHNLATCTIGLLDPSQARLDFVAHRGLPAPTSRLVKDLPPELWRKVRRLSEPALIADTGQVPELLRILERPDLKSFFVIPLRGTKRFLGILTMGSTEPLHLDQEDWDLLQAFSEQAAAAIENAQLYQEIHQVNKAMEDSMQIITHQLREEPTFVTNTIDTLLAGKLGELNEQQRDRLEKARRRLDQHHRLINNLNRYGKLKGHKIVPRKKQIDLAALIQDTVDTWQRAASRKELTLEAEIHDLPIINADPGMMDIILTNLLDNAIKFTPKGGRIHVRGQVTTDGILLTLNDTGSGIPQEQRDKVFEEYHQLPSTQAQAGKGAGLGLYIAKNFVEMHKGLISIDSNKEGGAQINILLPLKPSTPL